MKLTPHASPALYIRCQKCDEHEWRVEHITRGTRFGPWDCHTVGCDTAITGTRLESGDVEAEFGEPRSGRALYLLRGQGMWLVVHGYCERDGTAPNADYYYGEHTCPTNVMSDVEEVFTEEGEADPHGLFLPVAHVVATKERVERLDGASFGDVLAMFGMSPGPAETN
jgi:hypothetical protein